MKLSYYTTQAEVNNLSIDQISTPLLMKNLQALCLFGQGLPIIKLLVVIALPN
jgi:hypothetical protein